jgi:hypothetical protein
VKVKDTYKPIKKNNELYMQIYRKREEILNGPLYQIFDMIQDLHALENPR